MRGRRNEESGDIEKEIAALLEKREMKKSAKGREEKKGGKIFERWELAGVKSKEEREREGIEDGGIDSNGEHEKVHVHCNKRE